MRARSCPSHPEAMEALYVAAADGGSELEIDRCAECGALWFDAGELEMAAEVHARPSSAESEYRCPVCRQQMQGASLPRGLLAHRCDSCQGTFLDGSNVAALKSDALPRPPEKRARPSGTVGFVCAKCGQRFPYAQGNGTSLGLVCPGCVVNPQVEKLRRGRRTGIERGPAIHPSVDFDFDLLDVFDMIRDLFHR